MVKRKRNIDKGVRFSRSVVNKWAGKPTVGENEYKGTNETDWLTG
jgi:hypothetical protein